MSSRVILNCTLWFSIVAFGFTLATGWSEGWMLPIMIVVQSTIIVIVLANLLTLSAEDRSAQASSE